ncbi:MAG: SufD family Fe-S cluster assembly protein, partial [Myxococcota bacterium]
SRRALVDTKPQLEIFADDVRCTHGATIGQMEGDELFYLQSRGLGLAQARQALTLAFAGEVLAKIPVPSLREALRHQLVERLTAMGEEA